MGRLPHGQDVISAIGRFCRKNDIQMAAVSVHGAVSSVTLGTFDHQQQVYVTVAENGPLSFGACQGNISLKDERPFVYLSAVLSDVDGRTIAGRLFSETIVFAAEIDLQELHGPPLARHYDAKTGMMLWK